MYESTCISHQWHHHMIMWCQVDVCKYMDSIWVYLELSKTSTKFFEKSKCSDICIHFKLRHDDTLRKKGMNLEGKGGEEIPPFPTTIITQNGGLSSLHSLPGARTKAGWGACTRFSTMHDSNIQRELCFCRFCFSDCSILDLVSDFWFVVLTLCLGTSKLASRSCLNMYTPVLLLISIDSCGWMSYSTQLYAAFGACAWSLCELACVVFCFLVHHLPSIDRICLSSPFTPLLSCITCPSSTYEIFAHTVTIYECWLWSRIYIHVLYIHIYLSANCRV